jgi:hypothetical protein
VLGRTETIVVFVSLCYPKVDDCANVNIFSGASRGVQAHFDFSYHHQQ